jgi:prepilin-type N-terminal cleavage/methylation domain-containing protein
MTFSTYKTPPTKPIRGFTLIELIVSIGLFAVVMTLAAGAYITVISINDQTEGITTNIDNAASALDLMTRTIRTGTQYGCPHAGTDCADGGSTFSVTDSSGDQVSYTETNGVIYQTTNGGSPVPLTDPSITITSLVFYAVGTAPYSADGDTQQSRVTIVISGTVPSAPGKQVSFTVETGATMRGPDL